LRLSFRSWLSNRQFDELVEELTEVTKEAEEGGNIDEKVKQLEKALKKAPDDVKAAFGEALKALERRDFEKSG
jgi:phosphate uptake regulator